MQDESLPGTQEPVVSLPKDTDFGTWETTNLGNGSPLRYSSRSEINGATDSALCAGFQVATRPSRAIAATTPPSTTGSRGVA